MLRSYTFLYMVLLPILSVTSDQAHVAKIAEPVLYPNGERIRLCSYHEQQPEIVRVHDNIVDSAVVALVAKKQWQNTQYSYTLLAARLNGSLKSFAVVKKGRYTRFPREAGIGLAYVASTYPEDLQDSILSEIEAKVEENLLRFKEDPEEAEKKGRFDLSEILPKIIFQYNADILREGIKSKMATQQSRPTDLLRQSKSTDCC